MWAPLQMLYINQRMSFPSNAYEKANFIVSTLQMRELRSGEVKKVQVIQVVSRAAGVLSSNSLFHEVQWRSPPPSSALSWHQVPSLEVTP